MYEKLAKGILKNSGKNNPEKNDLEISIIGFKPKNLLENEKIDEENRKQKIKFYPVFDFHRLSPKRFLAQFTFFYLLLKIRPKILVVCTFELLFFAVIYKIIFGTKLIYDVQENYSANIFYTKVFPAWVRFPLGYLVKFWEKFWGNWVDEFWLAEKCYLEELHLQKRNYIFLENKVVFEQIKPFLKNIEIQKNFDEKNIDTKTKFLISGTLGEDYGTHEAINWFKNYQKIYPNSTLDVIGFCAKKSDFEKIQNNILNCQNINLIGGNSLVDSNLILEYASLTDFWIMPYFQNKNIQNRIPTKFYEAIAFQKKIILLKNASQNITWKAFFKENNYIENVEFLDFPLDFFELKKQNFVKNNPFENEKNQFFNLEKKSIFWENELNNLEKSKVFGNI